MVVFVAPTSPVLVSIPPAFPLQKGGKEGRSFQIPLLRKEGEGR